MARLLILDPFHGASGDMLLGAMVALGVPLEHIASSLRTLGVRGWRLDAESVRRGTIAATKVRVRLDALGGGEETLGDGHGHAHPHAHGGGHDHAHDHDHGHDHHGHHHHDHGHDHSHHGHAHDHGHGDHHLHTHGMTPLDMTSIVVASGLSARAKSIATRAISVLAVAEATVHGTTPDRVHFHEVGAIDALVDICGTAVAVDHLSPDAVYCRRITTGFGTVRCAHGPMPVPAPATTLILAGLPTRDGDLEAELTTPTGAALLRALTTSFDPVPEHAVVTAGFGAGNSDWPGRANVLRAVLAERVDGTPSSPDEVAEVVCEIDDMRSEGLAFLAERLFEAGALDVNFTAVTMKKGRPGHRLTLLSTPVDRERLSDLVLRHSTTFGLRWRTMRREVLDRDIVTVATADGPCRVKVGRLRGRVVRLRPEYEDVAALARRSGKPIDLIEAEVLRDGSLPPLG